MLLHSLVVEFVSLVGVEYEELVSAVRGEHLESTVLQEIASLVDLSHHCIWPLHTSDSIGRCIYNKAVLECIVK